MSAWSTAPAKLPSAAALWLALDLALDQQRADQGDRRDPGHRQAGDGEPEAPLLASRGLGADRRGGELARSGRRPGRRRRGRRPRRAPAISQNQSKPAPTAKASIAAKQRRVALALRVRRRAPGGEAGPEQRPDQAEHEQAADHAQLGEGLQVERVGVVHRQLDRAVLLPGELVGAGAVAEDRLFARRRRSRPARSRGGRRRRAGEKCCSGLVRELDVGAGELVPGAAADRDRDPDRDHRDGRARRPAARAGLRESSTARPVSRPPRRSGPAQRGEEQQRERDARRAGSAAR